DAGAGVPAGVRLLRIVDAHRDHVAGAGTQVRRQLVAERAVAIRPFAEGVPVDPDFAVAIDAVEIDENALPLVGCGHRKCLAVPSDSARQRAAGGTCGVLLAEVALDAPVVGQVQLAPRGVIERRLLRAGDIAKMKAPTVIEAG